MKFFLKLIADLCFYLTFATVAMNELSRFVPTFVWFVPAGAYVIYAIATHRKFAANIYYRTVFTLYVKIFAVYSVLAILPIPLFLDFYQRVSLPLALLFFVSATSLMRLCRHSDKVQKQLVGKLVSSGPIVVLVFVTVLVSLAWATGVFGTIASTFYFEIFIPLLLLAARGLLFLISPLLNWLMRNDPLVYEYEYEAEEFEQGAYDGGFIEGFEWITPIDALGPILAVLVIMVGVALVALLVRALAKKAMTVFDEDGAIQEHIPLDVAASRRGKQKNKMRKIYIRFLARCSKNGIKNEDHLTSEDYRRLATKKFGMEDDLQKLREIYLPVRYNDAEIRVEDLSFAKKLVAKLKTTR